MIYKIQENRVVRTYIGGKAIDKFYGKAKCEDNLFPEDWTASVTMAYNSTNEKSEGLGRTQSGILIKDIVKDEKLNILVKLLNSAQRLVIQAHPTVDFAKKHLNSDYGKTECWYFLECDDNACVYMGFKNGIDRKEWEKAFYDNDSEKMLSMLHCIPVKKGDFIFVDGGVPHAIGAGCFIIELQEPSDLMVVNERFTPSGREIPEKRLHMGLGYEKMFDVYDYKGYTYEELIQKFCPVKKKLSDNVYCILGGDLTDKFCMYQLKSGARLDTQKNMRIAIVESGNGCINKMKVCKGERLFLHNEKLLELNGDEEFSVIVCE